MELHFEPLKEEKEEVEFPNADEEILCLLVNYPEFFKRTILKPEYFEPKSKMMYEIILEEYEQAGEFIVDRLMQHNNFDVVYYSQLIGGNVYYSSKEIKFRELEKYIIERYKKERYQEEIKNFNGNCEQLYDSLTKLNEINLEAGDYITAREMFDALTKENKKLNLGYPILDSSLKLMQNDLLIIGGGTGTGKTAFAINLLNKVSKDYKCIYFNMEMSPTVLYKRMIGNMTDTTLKELEDINQLPYDKKLEIKRAMEEYQAREITLVNKVTNVKEMTKIVERAKTDKHIIVFVDHIGLVKATGNSIYERTTNVAKGLRTMCINSNCTVIALCQLSRNAQRSEDKPVLQDLRDSGEIEQSARKAILLWNKSSNKQDRVNDMEVIIAKNDDGERKDYTFKFDRYTQTFREIYK